jgi:hypothetical protein
VVINGKTHQGKSIDSVNIEKPGRGRPVTRNRTKQVGAFVIGDASVRGLGPMIQTRDIDGQVVVRDGRTFREVGQDVEMDVSRVIDGTTIVLGFGLKDLDNTQLEEAKHDVDRLVSKLESKTERVHVGLLTIPPQTNTWRDGKAKEINSYMVWRCMDSHVKVIDSDLTLQDISRDGIHLNSRGKVKMAIAIKKCVGYFSEEVQSCI